MIRRYRRGMMANKQIRQRIVDADVEAVKEIEAVISQRFEGEIVRLKEEQELLKEDVRFATLIQRSQYDIAHAEFLRAVTLYQAKQSKSYRKTGKTWVVFCEEIGISDRTADEIIKEIKPVLENFSAGFAKLFGVGLNKIRHLGKAISAGAAEIQDGVIVFDGEKIPLTPEYKDEIEAILDQLKDGLKEREDEAKAQKKASDRLQAETHKEIVKLNKQVDKLEGKAAKKGFTAEEDAYLQHIGNLRTTFDGYLLQIDPERMEELNAETVTPRMRAAYLSAMDYFKKQILVYADTAIEMHGDIVMCAENAWQQPE